MIMALLPTVRRREPLHMYKNSCAVACFSTVSAAVTRIFNASSKDRGAIFLGRKREKHYTCLGIHVQSLACLIAVQQRLVLCMRAQTR